MLGISYKIQYEDPESEERCEDGAETFEEAQEIADELSDAGYTKIKIIKLRT